MILWNKKISYIYIKKKYNFRQRFQQIAKGIAPRGNITVMREPSLVRTKKNPEDYINKVQIQLANSTTGSEWTVEKFSFHQFIPRGRGKHNHIILSHLRADKEGIQFVTSFHYL